MRANTRSQHRRNLKGEGYTACSKSSLASTGDFEQVVTCISVTKCEIP
ncbi:hypothetical protein [Candidatus Regiella endosymbiont of Tuberolachnus salignus]